MPSELQRVARGLVDCFDEIPRVVEQLQRTAVRCRENAQLALIAPPKARGWVEGLLGTPGPSTNRLSSDSPDRNKTTSGSGDLDGLGRTKRLTFTYEDLEVAEDNEPPLITVARKAFEKYRKTHENDDDRDAQEPLEVEITILESGELEFEEPNEKEDQKRRDHLLADFEIEVDLTESVKTLLAAMTASSNQQWHHATLTITPNEISATFDYPEDPHPQPTVVDINLPDLPKLDFDPALDLRPIGGDFAPGVSDPADRFEPKERELADFLGRRGWRIDARPENHTVHGQKNPDATLRRGGAAEGVIVEFKTLNRASLSAVKRNINEACDQVGDAGEVFIDGRKVELDEAMALRGFRKACGQPGKSVDALVHVILGDERMVTFRKER
jgi:hypothetical protein